MPLGFTQPPLSQTTAAFGPSDEPDAFFTPVTCCVIGFTVAIPIAPEARMTLFDFVALFLLFRYWRTAKSMLWGAAIALLISMVAMTVSAEVNGSGMAAVLGRGYSPILLLVEIGGFVVLLRNTSDTGQIALTLGNMIGICCHFFYPNDLRVLDEPIKFLLGVPLGVILLALYSLAARQINIPALLVSSLMILYAFFCFFLGSRSIGGVYFVSAIILIIIKKIKTPKNYTKLAPFIIMLSLLIAYGFTELYSLLAIKGFFGSRAAAIAAFQSSFGSILLGGRPEIIVNISGIRDAPLLGVGIGNYPSLYLYEMNRLSVYSQQDIFDIGNILYHSSLFATAFETGVISAMFWSFLLYRSIFAVPLLTNVSSSIQPFSIPLIIISIWHILYSPPIPYNRFVMGIGISLALCIYSQWKEVRKIDKEQ